MVRATGWKRRLRTYGERGWRALQAGEGVRRGTAWAAGVVLALLAVLAGTTMPAGFGAVGDFVFGVALFLVTAAVFAALTVVAAGLVRLLARTFSWRGFLLLAAGIGVALAVAGPVLMIVLPVALPLLVIGAVLGAAFDGAWGERSRWSRGALVVVGCAAVAALVVVVSTYADRGSDDHLVDLEPDPVAVAPLDLSDPSRPGPYPVRTLTYGSGSDRRRSEFGPDADLVTDTVDGSAFVKGSTGWQMRLRAWYWGFDEEAMPINGRVWYPEGEGPFPLVLIVHGNHGMEDFSDPGYEWLGKLLASRGFILASVDQNFLNGSFRGSPTKENDARGWLLLEHLRVWQGWSELAEGPFAGRVDLDRIALIGHSRGGEAAAIAAAFNRLERYPDDATVALPHGFGVRSVVAIAPSDGQYEPMGRATPLEGVNYLVLQGGHDADVSTFMGARQWQRADLGAGQFKASIWVYRANHGQFNTVWGETDYPWPYDRVLNLEPLLPGDEQRALAGVAISAFLEATLSGRDEYRELFRDHRRAAEWLPDDLLITRYRDDSFVPIADFEGDIDVTTGAPGVSITGSGLAVWREKQLGFRKQGSKRNGVAELGWRAATDGVDEPAPAPSYELRLGDSLRLQPVLGAGALLVLDLADTGNDPPRSDDAEGGDGGQADPPPGETGDEAEQDPEPLDLSVELEDAAGVRARLPLSAFRRLPPPAPSRMTKLPAESFMYGSQWEVILQTFELPLGRFTAAVPAFDPSALAAIRLVFDRSTEGMIVLDDVGLARPRAGS